MYTIDQCTGTNVVLVLTSFYTLVIYSTCSFQGNFDSYIKTRAELEENQMKQYNWEQDQIKHMKVRLSTHLHEDNYILFLLPCKQGNILTNQQSVLRFGLILCRNTLLGLVMVVLNSQDKLRVKRKC